MNMHRPEERQAEMERNAEHLQSLALLENVLDEELERIGNEYHWNSRKYVYLQALDCDSGHLRDLAATMQRSRGLLVVLQSLLEQTFQEKVIFMQKVKNQQLQWKAEDECIHHKHSYEMYQQQQKQYTHCTYQEDQSCEKHQHHDQHQQRVKYNKSMWFPQKSLTCQRLKSKICSRAHLKRISIADRKRKSSVKICYMGLSKFRNGTRRFSATSRHVTTTGARRGKFSQPRLGKGQQPTTERLRSAQKETHKRRQHFTADELRTQVQSLANETLYYMSQNCQSASLLHSVARHGPISTEGSGEGVDQIWRRTEAFSSLGQSDLCFDSDYETGFLIGGRDE